MRILTALSILLIAISVHSTEIFISDKGFVELPEMDFTRINNHVQTVTINIENPDLKVIKLKIPYVAETRRCENYGGLQNGYNGVISLFCTFYSYETHNKTKRIRLRFKEETPKKLELTLKKVRQYGTRIIPQFRIIP